MSQENVETVLSTFRAFQEHDGEALFANYTPGIEWDMRGYSPWADQQPFRAPAAAYGTRVWRSLRDLRMLS